LINDASSANADRVQQMAIAVATDGQNLVAKSNEKNLYIIGGVSVAAVLSMIVMARVKK
jgi:dihydrofolate reductase